LLLPGTSSRKKGRGDEGNDAEKEKRRKRRMRKRESLEGAIDEEQGREKEKEREEGGSVWARIVSVRDSFDGDNSSQSFPGSPYPVVEHPKENSALKDVGITGGYQSHYVLTGKVCLLLHSSYHFPM